MLLVDQAYEDIKNMICNFELIPGQIVSDFTLSKKMGMSRTPIRQALQKLEGDDLIVDAAAMNLVLNPENYDVMVMPNLYGDILSDLGAGLVGGLGIIPSANIGKDCAIFEAVHGSAPQIAGQNKANPTALIQSSVMMLRYLGEYENAQKIETALEKVFLEGSKLTVDLGGSASTTEFADEVCKYIV